MDGKWDIYNGNEIGIIIAHWLFTQYVKKNPDCDRSKIAVINSTVSSKMLSAFAKKENIYYEETLTGFKNIGALAESLRNKGYFILMGFEEAIGYMVGDTPLDKDGISAAAVISEMAHSLYHQGSTIYGTLQSLYDNYGHFVTNNKYFFCYDSEIQPLIFQELRNGGNYHKTCGPYGIQRIRDLGKPGYDSATPDHKPIFPVSGSGMITYYFENGATITLRGSGTEPKLKYYAELQGSNYADTKRTLDDLLAHFIDLFIQPKKYGDKLVTPV